MDISMTTHEKCCPDWLRSASDAPIRPDQRWHCSVKYLQTGHLFKFFNCTWLHFFKSDKLKRKVTGLCSTSERVFPVRATGSDFSTGSPRILQTRRTRPTPSTFLPHSIPQSHSKEMKRLSNSTMESLRLPTSRRDNTRSRLSGLSPCAPNICPFPFDICRKRSFFFPALSSGNHRRVGFCVPRRRFPEGSTGHHQSAWLVECSASTASQPASRLSSCSSARSVSTVEELNTKSQSLMANMLLVHRG